LRTNRASHAGNARDALFTLRAFGTFGTVADHCVRIKLLHRDADFSTASGTNFARQDGGD
jgi:hypothetical protein